MTMPIETLWGRSLTTVGVLLLSLGLAGCGNGDGDDTAGGMQDQVQDMENEAATAEQQADAMAESGRQETDQASVTEVTVELSGDNQVPPVETEATGNGTIMVAEDGAVSGSVTVEGLDATAAHIHTGGPDESGGVAVPLEQTGENEWSVVEGATLSPEQMELFRAGELYVNVHTQANPGGEIRGQIEP